MELPDAPPLAVDLGVERAASRRGDPPPVAGSGVEQALKGLSERIDATRSFDQFGVVLAGFRTELSDIGRKLEDAAPRRALDALEAEMRTLSGRVERDRARGADAAVLASVERELSEVRRVLVDIAPSENLEAFRGDVRLLQSKTDAMLASGGDADAVETLAQPISGLREVAARAASPEVVSALSEDVRALIARVDHLGVPLKSTTDVLASLEQRLEGLAGQINRPAPAPSGNENRQLVAMVESLTDRFERIEVSRGSGPMLDQITEQLARLSERLEVSGARVKSIDVLERGVSELFDHFETLHATTVTTAERAARAAVQGAEPGAAGPDLEALNRDLEGVRQAQAHNDKRTQESLELVHDTLERLVDRLATVESELRGERRENVHAAAPRAESGDGHYALAKASAPASAAHKPPAGLASDRRPIDPTLPGDHPLEPGSAAPLMRAPATPAERIAASEAVLGPNRPAAETDSKSNFIAAARRAAQAAASMADSGEAGPSAPKAGRSKFGAIAQKMTGRRALVLGFAGLLIAGTVHLVLTIAGNGPSQTAPAARSTIGDAARSVRDAAKVVATRVAPASTPASTPGTLSSPIPSPLATPAQSGNAQPVAKSASATTDSSAAAAPATSPTVSPLTIASIQMPTGEVTGSTGRNQAFAISNQSPMPTLGTAAAEPRLPATVGAGLRAAALSGNPAAEYEIALQFSEGRGTPASLEEAARWFERAANRDLTPAQYRLAGLYEKGQGVKKDLEKARQLYVMAADKGHGKAMHNLAVLHAEGVEGKPEFKMAAHWFRRAADRGIADSQYNLAILHARGLGVEQNLAESYKWFALAAGQGDQDAGKKRDDIAARLDAQTLAAAKLAVATFAPEAQPDAVTTVRPPQGGWEVPAAAAPKAKPHTPRRPTAS